MAGTSLQPGRPKAGPGCPAMTNDGCSTEATRRPAKGRAYCSLTHQHTQTSSPGLSRRSRFIGLHDLLIKITPFGVGLRDQARLPGARPMLHVLLALNRLINRIVNFEIDKLVDAETLGVPGNESVLVFVNAPNQILRDADVNGAPGAAGENIDI